MGARGPATKPTAMKLAEGTYRKDRVAKNEMIVDRLANIPDVPEQLKNSYAVDAWCSMTETLFALNMLHAADLAMVMMYAIYIGRAMEASDYLAENGDTVFTPNGFEQAHPKVKIMNDSFDRANRLAGQFGFTPSARTRIGMPEPKEQNPFDKFIS